MAEYAPTLAGRCVQVIVRLGAARLLAAGIVLTGVVGGLGHQAGASEQPLVAEGGSVAAVSASDVPGVPLTFGVPVQSVLDREKRRDVYSIALLAGQTMNVSVVSANATLVVEVLYPGAVSMDGEYEVAVDWRVGGSSDPLNEPFLAAVDGTYYIVVWATTNSQSYTITVAEGESVTP